MIQERIWVTITNNAKYWRSLGYSIPMRWSRWKKGGPGPVIAQGEQIEVNTSDLPKNSCIKVNVTCDNCALAKTITYQKYVEYLKPKDFYSCHSCAASKNAKSMRGPKHPNWNPQITPEQRLKNKEHRYHEDQQVKNWRIAIYSRDRHTCQSCTAVGGSLQAHHLNGWAEHPEERYILDNGITLCRDCHGDFHRTFGKKTTRRDWDSYISGKLRN